MTPKIYLVRYVYDYSRTIQSAPISATSPEDAAASFLSTRFDIDEERSDRPTIIAAVLSPAKQLTWLVALQVNNVPQQFTVQAPNREEAVHIAVQTVYRTGIPVRVESVNLVEDQP